MVKNEVRTLAILTHILGLITGFIGPLIILLASENKEIKKHAKYALNWQISYMIYIIASLILMVVLIGFLTFAVVIILNIVFSIIAAVKSSNNELQKYPLAIPFLKV